MNIRRAVQRWLGLDDVPSVAMWKAMEQAQRERHSELMACLGRIETRLVITHQTERIQSFSAPSLDWDTVQAIALAELERNPQKES
jgi:hypothetical protein